MLKQLTRNLIIIAILAIGVAGLCLYFSGSYNGLLSVKKEPSTSIAKSIVEIPDYFGEDYITINGNTPMFSDEETAKAYDENGIISEGFIELQELDYLGRTGEAFMLVTSNTLATEERGSIGMVKPSGWNQGRYDDLIEDKYLYNRCHLLGFALSGLNAEKRNLITCTRQMNIGRMLEIEVKVANYARNGGSVLYRVTPYYDGDDLLAKGALIEAKSLDSDEIEICEFVYNVQDGITIDYVTGENRRS